MCAQKIMAKYFHMMAKFKWADIIAKEIWKFVQHDFDFDMGADMTID